MEEPKTPVCPKCGSKDTKSKKSWILENARTETKTEITIYLCRECGKTFRKGKRLPEA